ncbi:MAG: GNAT family N-acetyltransferase [Thermoanaerobaculia bacterium]|nr:GNAT family N-acetyltransferase [Thermoanaerobaculia bacterium]
MAFVVRDATDADAPRIVEFQLAMARETEGIELDLETCTRGVAAVFADSELGRYFVAAQDGNVVGSLMITYEWSDWRNGVVWWIQSVYVVPEARGGGVYRRMYEAIQRLVRESSAIRGIRLYVDTRNTAAQQVYERLGMDGGHYRVFEWMKG